MRRLSAALIAAFCLGAIASTAAAEPSDKCGGAPAVVSPGTPEDDGIQIAVCVAGVGALEAKDAGGYGYIVADGDSGMPGCLSGYIGIEGDTAGNFNYVASSSGDYSPPRNGSPANPDPTECAA